MHVFADVLLTTHRTKEGKKPAYFNDPEPHKLVIQDNLFATFLVHGWI